jgi:hypothetical protein
MTRRGDKVKESVNAVIAEARVTLDTALLREDVVVLPLKVSDDFLEAEPPRMSGFIPQFSIEKLTCTRCRLKQERGWSLRWTGERVGTSLLLSPNPGVSTIVKLILTPSSSSSTLTGLILIPSSMWALSGMSATLCVRTSLSQRVFTKVVRPEPEAPGEIVNIQESRADAGQAATHRQPSG